MKNEKGRTKKDDRGPGTAGVRLRPVLAFSFFLFPFSFLVGCQQKMATQPAPRPYDESSMFQHGQSARPLVGGVVHRAQYLSDDPLVTWLSAKGKKPTHTDTYKAWVDEQARTPLTEDGTPAGKPVLDKDGKAMTRLTAAAASELKDNNALQPGSPTDTENFVKTVPFEMTAADLTRGRTLFAAVCAECHGGAGHANGKIAERGYLRPPSYHPDPDGKAKDWSRHIVATDSQSTTPDFTGNPQGYSRGFYKYGKEVALKDVPIGYIYQVIYWGYGGMGSHETQLPHPDDRWRVAAYVRVLQLTQAVKAEDLPAEVTKELADKKAHANKPAHGEHK